MRYKDSTQQVQEDKLRLSFAFQSNRGANSCNFSIHIPWQELQIKGRKTIIEELEQMLEKELLKYKLEINEKIMCHDLLKSFSERLIDGIEIWQEKDFKKKISWTVQTSKRLLSSLLNQLGGADVEECEYISNILENLMDSLFAENTEEKDPANLQKNIEQVLQKMNLEDSSHYNRKLLIHLPKIAAEMMQSVQNSPSENIMEVVNKLIGDIQKLIILILKDESQEIPIAEISDEELSSTESESKNEEKSSLQTLDNENKIREAQNFLDQFEDSIFAMNWKPRLSKGELVLYSPKPIQDPEKEYYLTKNSFWICMNIRKSREDGNIHKTVKAIDGILKKSATQEKQSWTWQEKVKAFFLRDEETQKNYDELYSQFVAFKQSSSSGIIP